MTLVLIVDVLLVLVIIPFLILILDFLLILTVICFLISIVGTLLILIVDILLILIIIIFLILIVDILLILTIYISLVILSLELIIVGKHHFRHWDRMIIALKMMVIILLTMVYIMHWVLLYWASCQGICISRWRILIFYGCFRHVQIVTRLQIPRELLKWSDIAYWILPVNVRVWLVRSRIMKFRDWLIRLVICLVVFFP